MMMPEESILDKYTPAQKEAWQQQERNRQLERVADEMETMLTAAVHALRSYQYGNSSEELAKEMADKADAALASYAKWKGK